MTGEFANKTILVTGSTRGIGAAAAELFLARGGSVILHGRRQVAVDAALARLAPRHSGRISGLVTDLCDRDQCRTLAGKVTELDILVNCGGVFREASVAETSPEIWGETMAVNLTAPWVLSRALAPALRRRRGCVVNVASDAALLGYAGCAAYCASKGALVGLTRALAIELAPEIRALCVCPGSTDTDMMRESVAAAPDEAEAVRQWASYNLFDRFATPAEIGEAILFAASPLAAFQTGSLILVDGGASAAKRV